MYLQKTYFNPLRKVCNIVKFARKKNKGKEEKCKLTHYALSTIAEPSSEGGLRCPWLRGLYTPSPLTFGGS